MLLREPLYTGVHRPARPAAAPLFKSPEMSALDLAAIERRAHKLRALEIGALIERFLVWLERTVERAYRKPVDEYLAQATDHADLERRQRQVDRSRRPLIF
ncbi:MAG: DUF3563 family protein [Betaproteobacteria bacterium]|nr:DUF3563 family protein [Betaproteobacteria bacterium]